MFPSLFVKKIAKQRSIICESNACGFYDLKGTSPLAVLRGKPACAGCGCNIKVKTHSLSSFCYLKDIERNPLWDAVMSESEEITFREKTGLKNE